MILSLDMSTLGMVEVLAWALAFIRGLRLDPPLPR